MAWLLYLKQPIDLLSFLYFFKGGILKFPFCLVIFCHVSEFMCLLKTQYSVIKFGPVLMAMKYRLSYIPRISYFPLQSESHNDVIVAMYESL